MNNVYCIMNGINYVAEKREGEKLNIDNWKYTDTQYQATSFASKALAERWMISLGIDGRIEPLNHIFIDYEPGSGCYVQIHKNSNAYVGWDGSPTTNLAGAKLFDNLKDATTMIPHGYNENNIVVKRVWVSND